MSRPSGYKHTEETKRKISIGNTGKKRTAKTLRLMRAINLGRKQRRRFEMTFSEILVYSAAGLFVVGIVVVIVLNRSK